MRKYSKKFLAFHGCVAMFLGTVMAVLGTIGNVFALGPLAALAANKLA